jgi:hypothetical protein
MKSWKPLYHLLLLTDVPNRWAAWQVAAFVAGVAAMGGLTWGWAGGRTAGVGVALGLAALSAVDGWLLASLPRWRISFGAYQGPLAGLALARCLAALALLPLLRPAPGIAVSLLILVQAAGLALAAWGLLVEPFRLRVMDLSLESAALAGSAGRRPLRLVQLSDLHVERLTRRERALPALVAGLEPDLILLTGDFLNGSYKRDPAAVADLAALLGELHAPGGVYACLGTIEVDLPEVLRPALAAAGVVLLEDQAVELSCAGHRLWLAGVTCTRDPEADGARLRALLAGAPGNALRLLLYHMPDLMPQAAALGIDLMLAGHTHGGQWCLPGVGALITDSRYGKRYEAGHYVEGGTHLYVSRGLGMEGWGAPRARFFCPPEVVAVTVRAAER